MKFNLEKLHNEELNDVYTSPNTNQVIKSKRRWAGRVARMEEKCLQSFSGES
jgi:hypothetical protein